jgi:protein-tyrosine phosphatase
MIDIHCHLLPGLDDGPDDMGETLGMCRLAQSDGIKTLVATPHCRNGVYHNQEKTILPVVKQVQEVIRQAEIPIQILPGADLHIHPEALSFLKENPKLLLGDRYYLLELPAQSIPPYTREFIFKSLLAGYFPILTHPERNSQVQSRHKLLEEWVEAGVLIQITAMSLTGEFGGQVRKCALSLIRSGLVHVLASDAHSSRRRPPVLSKAREVLETIVGPEKARTLVKDIPEKILKGESVETNPREKVSNTRKSFLIPGLRKIFHKKGAS